MFLGIGLPLTRIGQLAPFFEGASLDMLFTRGAYSGLQLADLSVTRGSAGYAQNASGVWTLFGNNVPRITNKGILIEESRTNVIRNNSMQGAIAGSPTGSAPTNWNGVVGPVNGITRRVSAVGRENGVDYIDVTFSGAATVLTAGTVLYFDATMNAFPAATGEVWTQSCFMKIVSGDFTGFTDFGLTLRENSVTPAFLRQTLVDVLGMTGTLTRYSGQVTLGASTTGISPGLRYSIANGATPNLTIRIGWPQLERGAFVSSPIRTMTTAGARSSDDVNSTSVAWLTSQAPMTLYAETDIPQTNTSVAYRAIELDDGTDTARISNSGGNWLGIYNTDGSATAGAVAANVVQKSAVAIAANDLAACMNGGAVGTDASVTALTGLDRITFGASKVAGSVMLNGYLRRVAYFPTRLSNAELQAITTP